jgi:hypothetical protein
VEINKIAANGWSESLAAGTINVVLAYDSRVVSSAPHWRYAAYQQCARFGGAGFVRFSSRLWNRLHRT